MKNKIIFLLAILLTGNLQSLEPKKPSDLVTIKTTGINVSSGSCMGGQYEFNSPTLAIPKGKVFIITSFEWMKLPEVNGIYANRLTCGTILSTILTGSEQISFSCNIADDYASASGSQIFSSGILIRRTPLCLNVNGEGSGILRGYFTKDK